MTRSTNITWITLLILTITSFTLAERGETSLVWLIVALAGVKFALVAWKFMELQKAAFIWSAGVFGVLSLILGLIIILS